MAEETKLWHKWWFWALMIPMAAVVSVEADLPLKDPWFWGILVGGGLAWFYINRRYQVLKGTSQEFQALREQITDLRQRIEQRQLAQTIVEANDLLNLKQNLQGIVVIMFSDIVGFTTYVEHHGDELAYERLKYHNRLIRNALLKHEGTEVKHLGDGFMASFNSAREALLCAAEIQSQLRTLEDDPMPLQVRIGIHAGEPIQEESDFVGRTVIVAQRIMNQAKGGQIYLSEVVKTLVGSMKGYQYVDQGKRRLGGITEAQTLFEFHPVDALVAPPDSVIDHRLETLEKRINKKQAS